QVNAGQSMMAVACQYGMSYGLLYQWVRKYREEGYNGLVSKKKGQQENAYIKAENAVIKKQIALRRQKWAAQLKAKKQQSSRNSARKDTR
ncbi:helix-turn-helix domain-containing protein, partial [Acidaminococcus intestini]|uniref:helix-turn-helix domain-containing protein n=1 Tax=Acidaminococcus intestini TaxID=187327 RepID=UPI0022E2F753